MRVTPGGADVLVVDDEADIRDLVSGLLEDEGHAVRTASNSEEALAAIRARKPSLLVLDIWMQGGGMDGLELLDLVMELDADLPVVMISGHGNIETAVSALKRGAYDFLEKPFKSDRLILVVERALEASTLKRENRRLRAKAFVPTGLIGSSNAAQQLRSTISKVAPANSRVLVEQRFRRVGGDTDVQVDVRVITSTSRDLRHEIAEGRFREDLFHRLNVVPIRVPPLSERRDDIGELVNYFINTLCESQGLSRRVLSDDALAVLQVHDWPGNVRQLRNNVERLLILATGDASEPITADMLPQEVSSAGAASSLGAERVIALPLREAREVFEREYLTAQIMRFGGNISRTAAFIGMERSALHRKLKSLGVAPVRGGGEDEEGSAD